MLEPWATILDATMSELESADPLYRPTSFWQPGMTALLDDLESLGLDQFKRWPSAGFFFYPRYGAGFTEATLARAVPVIREINPAASERWLRAHLIGATENHRDIDIVLALLDRARIPLDVAAHGESDVGSPPQKYRPFGPDGPAYGKAYLNYLKIVAAVSRHLDHGLGSVLEIGAGFGVLGEILLSSIPTIQYVNVDIPPLSVITHYYLSQSLPPRPLRSHVDLAGDRTFALEAGGESGSFSSWQLPLLTGAPDLCLNAFSFQEMEPHVVENYADQIARLGARTVVSLNSRAGKPVRQEGRVGVEQQVLSAFIATTFAARGYELVAALGRPAAPAQAELLIMRRR
jgi:putative sugar O-methyltransferase